MTPEWKDILRQEMETASDESQSQHCADVVAYLKAFSDEWGAQLGIGELTAQFLRESLPTEQASEAFEDHLVETMRRAYEIRNCFMHARSLWDASQTFGKAIRNLTESISEHTTLSFILASINDTASPTDVGTANLADIARRCGFLRIFCLVTYALEQEFLRERNALVAEGLARVDRRLSEEERRRQALKVATALLDAKRRKAIELLVNLANTQSSNTI